MLFYYLEIYIFGYMVNFILLIGECFFLEEKIRNLNEFIKEIKGNKVKS